MSETDRLFAGAIPDIYDTQLVPMIFAPDWVEEQRAVFMLTPEQQTELNAHHPAVYFPVPNKWGDKGATFVELKQASERVFKEGLRLALNNVG